MKTKYLLVFILTVITGSVLAQSSLFDDVNFSIDSLEINSGDSDFGPAIIGDQLFFSSNAGANSRNKNKAFYNLYSAPLGPDGNIVAGREKVGGMVSKYHEGPMTFCEQTGELFLTQSNWENPEEENIVFKKRNVRLGIVVYEKNSGNWEFKESFPFNSSEFSVAHPTISRSGDTLIFASDMPGGQGATDLYYSVRLDGNWSEPVNLGSKVNSQGKEMFPYLNTDGSLVYSSDGHGGEGNLDLYYIGFPVNATSERRTFLGNVNSAADDFGLIIHPNQQAGYFCSNREGGEGSDDIYFLKIEDFKINLTTISNLTKRPLIGTTINVIDENGNIAATGKSNDAGKLSLRVAVDHEYTVVASVDNYLDKAVDLDLTNVDNREDDMEVFLDPEFVFKGQVVDIMGNVPIPDALVVISDGAYADSIHADYQGEFSYFLEPEKDYSVSVSAYNFFGTDLDFTTKDMKPGVVDYLIQLYSLDAGSRIQLKNIYYDLGQWNIRADASKELDRLATVMLDYPDLQIRLESHTDSRGGDDYNMDLSQKRSEAAYHYLVSKGVDPDRMEYVGFGETQLVNKCDDGIDCEEEVHQQNRRTVVEILKAKVTRRSKGNIFYF